MRFTKKLLFCLMLCSMLLVLLMPITAAENDITILYTNDIHTYIDNNVGNGNENNLTYSKLAALKSSLQNVVLVDAGDHVQGTAYGGLDNGATIIELMNAVGYDAATLGNHEFDYGMDKCMENMKNADFTYISCNFRHKENGVTSNTVLDAFYTIDVAGKKIAFVGITTPESFASSTPAYFQNENGEFIYDITGGEDGAALYSDVQAAIDAADAAGADFIIALGHLGIDPSSSPWTSKEVIANTAGLDAFIDGHSHSTVVSETVYDKNGNAVVLTQTGSYFDAIGKMTISDDGTVTSNLLSPEDLVSVTPNAEVKAIEDNWISQINSQLGKVIGYADITFDNFDSEGKRLVRKQSTNTGDFAADALYYLFDEMGLDVDAAIMNGGGVRNSAITGEISYLTCKKIHTFGNVACLQTITGQQLLDALEWGYSHLTVDGSAEDGAFLHVSGLRLKIDLSIPSTVQQDENGIWCGGPTGKYRVHDVEVYDSSSDSYKPLDLAAKYNLAGYNYTLRNLGDGFAMFDGAVNVLDYAAEDYMVLANYVQSFPVNEKSGLPTITSESGYADINGSGRITMINGEQAPEETTEPVETTVYTVKKGDSLWKLARIYYGAGAKWDIIYSANIDTIKNPNLIFVGQTLIIP